MARKTTDTKAKAKKQKIILGAGGVILLALLAFQLPKLMKGTASPNSSAATTVPVAGSTEGVSAPSGGSLASSTPSGDELRFTASVEQISSFTRFKAVDPFKPRVSVAPATSPSTTRPTPKAVEVPTTTSSNPAQGPLFGTVDGGALPVTNASAPSNGATTKTSAKTHALPSATLMFNGKRLHVVLGQAFPKANPVFRLAGIQSGSISIGLVKGGLADGSAVITLASRHPVTLVNTVDNLRYRMVLLTAQKGT
jgi:hypothetical protein